LMVDANGAYSRKQALRMAVDFASLGVTWFEEPVSSDDLRSLRLIQQRGPTGMEIAAGEYGYDLSYFRRMMQAGAVDVIQPDVTRCMGITGFLAVAALAEAAGVPVSAHTAPAQSLHACCAVRPLRHIEWFHDHVRIEQMLFEGAPRPERNGMVRPDLTRPGNGLVLRHADAERYRAP
jgi:L-alanine-DL-glutamate epimerase-like enolase superfamily enzyme